MTMRLANVPTEPLGLHRVGKSAPGPLRADRRRGPSDGRRQPGARPGRRQHSGGVAWGVARPGLRRPRLEPQDRLAGGHGHLSRRLRPLRSARRRGGRVSRSGRGVRGALAQHPERGSGPQAVGLSGDPEPRAPGLRRCRARRIEIATRAPDGRWWSLFLDRPEESLVLEALGVELAVPEIYASTRAAQD